MGQEPIGETLAERLGYPPEVVAEAEQTARRNAWRRELRERLESVSIQIGHAYNAQVKRLEAQGIDPFDAVTTDGQPVVAPLLASLGQVYAALAHMDAS